MLIARGDGKAAAMRTLCEHALSLRGPSR